MPNRCLAMGWTALLAMLAPTVLHAAAEGTVISAVARPLNDSQAPPMQVRIAFCGPMLRSYWRDASGRLLAADELVLDGQGNFTSYRYWLPSVAETLSARRKGGRVQIELREGARSRTRELRVPDGVQVGPTIMLRAREVAMGTGVVPEAMPYLVPDRFMVLDFRVARAVDQGDPGWIRVDPDSFIVRQFVDPIDVYFAADGMLKRVRGRSLVATGRPGHKDPMDVDLNVTGRATEECSLEPLARPPE